MIEMPSKTPFKTIPENVSSIGNALRNLLEKYWPDELFSEFCNHTEKISAAALVSPDDIFNIWRQKELGVRAENVKISFALSVAYYLRAKIAAELQDEKLASLMASHASYHLGYTEGYFSYVEIAEIDAKKWIHAGDRVKEINRHIESELIRLINLQPAESINSHNKAVNKLQSKLDSFIINNHYGSVAAQAENFISKHLKLKNGEARNQWLSKIGKPQDDGYKPRPPKSKEHSQVRLREALNSTEFWHQPPISDQPVSWRIPIQKNIKPDPETEKIYDLLFKKSKIDKSHPTQTSSDPHEISDHQTDKKSAPEK